MTIQQVIENEKTINQMMVSNQMMEAFEQFYGEDVVMIQNDGYTTTGKEESRKMEQGWMESLIEFRGAKLLSSVVMPSPDKEFEFLVVATWWNDYTMTLDGNQVDMKGNQTGFTYWKDGKIQKVEFKSDSEIIA
jgi:ketosteroid isomerase-like protein